MTTPNYSQPFLNNSSPPKTTHKILFFSLFIVAFFSLSYFSLSIIQPHSFIIPQIKDHHHHDHHSPSNGQDLLGKILPDHVSHINIAIEEIIKEINYKKSIDNVDHSQRGALVDCLELMDLSRDRVASSIKALTKSSKSNPNDINAWLSAVLTNHVTCMDQLQERCRLRGVLSSTLEGLIYKARVLLAMQVKASKEASNGMESLLETSRSRRSYPTWVRRSDRKLLEGLSGSEIEANVVVAKDGSGNFTTVAEAVAAAPNKGKKRYVIYVKEGVYEENVEVGKKKTNVMIVGDGMNLTVISGSLNFVDGTTTFKSATLAAVGDGFILQDICIENTAGAEKHQAVALRIGSDQSIINRCKISAYQDTLYAHSLRQFYRDCNISGTVDFFFGNAAVVLQNCKLIARKPMDKQKIMVTAQGRIDINQNTGTSIQYCDVIANEDLVSVQTQFPTFLGRPWKNFSRTVVMQSNIGGHIDPKGWSEWDGDFGLTTLYYGEFRNRGPGSDTSKRVNWTGFHVISDVEEAKQFTVGQFIQGQEWLDPQLVTYVEGL